MVCLAAAVHWGVWELPDALAHRDAKEQPPARRPRAALQRVAYSRELRPLDEPVWLLAVKQELQDEWVSEWQVPGALARLERLLAPALARQAWEQSSGPQSQQPEASPGERLERLVWPWG